MKWYQEPMNLDEADIKAWRLAQSKIGIYQAVGKEELVNDDDGSDFRKILG